MLFPEDDILIREIEYWKGFVDMLCSEDWRLFLQTLNDCHRYGNAINAKGEQFQAEALLMALRKMLVNKISIYEIRII